MHFGAHVDVRLQPNDALGPRFNTSIVTNCKTMQMMHTPYYTNAAGINAAIID